MPEKYHPFYEHAADTVDAALTVPSDQDIDAIIDELERFAPGLYVELGCFNDPYASNSTATWRFNGDHTYVAVDGGRSNYDTSDVIGWGPVHSVEHGGQRRYLLTREAERYGKDVDAIRFYGDVLLGLRNASQPNTNAHIVLADARTCPLPDAAAHNVYSSEMMLSAGMARPDIERIASEARRILKPDGMYVVRERANIPPQELIIALHRAGFAEVIMATYENMEPGFLELHTALNTVYGLNHKGPGLGQTDTYYIARGHMTEAERRERDRRIHARVGRQAVEDVLGVPLLEPWGWGALLRRMFGRRK